MSADTCYRCDGTGKEPSDAQRAALIVRGVSRAEVIERLIAADRRATFAERALKELADEHGEDKSLVHLIEIYQERIAVLEANQTRLLAERRQAA